jgi:hypothetical protein
MEKLQWAGAGAAFFALGMAMLLYEVARNKAKRPILNGGNAIQLYYCMYLTFFVLGATCLAALVFR